MSVKGYPYDKLGLTDDPVVRMGRRRIGFRTRQRRVRFPCKTSNKYVKLRLSSNRDSDAHTRCRRNRITGEEPHLSSNSSVCSNDGQCRVSCSRGSCDRSWNYKPLAVHHDRIASQVQTPNSEERLFIGTNKDNDAQNASEVASSVYTGISRQT